MEAETELLKGKGGSRLRTCRRQRSIRVASTSRGTHFLASSPAGSSRTVSTFRGSLPAEDATAVEVAVSQGTDPPRGSQIAVFCLGTTFPVLHCPGAARALFPPSGERWRRWDAPKPPLVWHHLLPMSPSNRRTIDLGPLVELVTHLRGPKGCPWDREQTLQTLRPYLLEEAHEVAAALDAEDPRQLAQELGDLLFQVAFLGSLAEEKGWFPLETSIETVQRKMIDRHPHVFGSESLATAAEVASQWERRKLAQGHSDSFLDGAASPGLRALVAAYRLTQKAAGVGFDWAEPEGALKKVEEELQELRGALESLEQGAPGARTALEAELGDLLFAVANLARKLEIDPEGALARTLLRFRQRFQFLESRLREQGRNLQDATLEEMDALWEEAKARGL